MLGFVGAKAEAEAINLIIIKGEAIKCSSWGIKEINKI